MFYAILTMQEMSRTNPIGPKSKNLSVNLPEESKEALHELAKANHMKIGEYVRCVLFEAIKERYKFAPSSPVRIPNPDKISSSVGAGAGAKLLAKAAASASHAIGEHTALASAQDPKGHQALIKKRSG